MDVAAVFLVGIAQLDGDISQEQKQAIIELFETEFQISSEKAQALLSSSTFLLNDEQNLIKNTPLVITPSKLHFLKHQINSLLKWMQMIAELDTPQLTHSQNQIIQAVKPIFGIK